MIEQMRKYSFVLYHLDYESFLTKLQRLGVLHIIKNTDAKSDNLTKNLQLVADYSETVKLLKKLNSEAEKIAVPLPTKALLNKIHNAREEREKLLRHEELIKKQIKDLNPWGHFDYSLLERITENGIRIDFHSCLKNHFKTEWQQQYPVQIINEKSGILYFIVLYTDESPKLEADTFSFHHHTLQEFETDLTNTEQKIKDIDQFLSDISPAAIDLFETEIRHLIEEYDFEDAAHQAIPEAENHVRVLNGWIPVTMEKELIDFLKREGVIHFAEKGKTGDNPPIKLRNNYFSRLFEPISKMYMLPYYNEFDLTPFFAPFFMLFFGFCNADMAYGVILILLGLFLRHRAKNQMMRDYMMLIVIFGAASILMGAIVGSVLGYDLKKMALIGDRIIIRNNDQIFNFALLLGVVQILFGVMINSIKLMRQSGFRHGISGIGIFIFLGSLSVMGAKLLGADTSSLDAYTKYPMYAGLFLILFFNAPGKNPIINVLGGIWLLYNVVTGFFGDILSYIRLFALGVSSAILGFVVNSIGAQMLGIPIAGPVIFLIFMLFGHGLNLALGALSGFVHPMRLTFVEFFKNAGFNGPGLQYKPFGKKLSN
ncbi:MAG: V-type ATPase 116kDa subunit family protein [Candidatus Cloacimonadaceae bacterium]|nr:V-type ATPase 116kDa subunit family protein [Candidatus Cloacimonadaceae bacterium]